ncbi:hypothetical protein [Mesomycoplasma hyorhinis]|uniref:hypothetical protein n=1 Tax=Mesomycoplasma hyorhinis TaxID=2100 RepID=UPI001C0452E4|nr:hypothetical protein [Mesomycoplasma hyorhinis]
MKYKFKLLLLALSPLSITTLIACQTQTQQTNKQTQESTNATNSKKSAESSESNAANSTPIVQQKNVEFKGFYNFKDFIEPNNGFVHKNFFTKKLENNKFEKFYRFYNFIYEDKWRKKNNKFYWTIDINEIEKVLNKDKNVENPTLWFYVDVRDNIEDLDKFHTSATDRAVFSGVPKFEFKNQLNYMPSGSQNKYNSLSFSIGISFNFEEFLKQKYAKFELKNNYEIEAKLEDNEINFYLNNSKSELSDDITYVRNLYQNYQNQLDNNKKETNSNTNDSQSEQENNVEKPNTKLIMPNNSFVSLSYITDNKENKTLQKYVYPSQYNQETIKYDKEDKIIPNDDKRYQWLPKTVDIFPDDWVSLVDPDPSKTFKKNPNAFDKSTQEAEISFDHPLTRKLDNNFVNSLERILPYNKFDPEINDLQIRSFGNRGTYTMISKVKPNDDNDQRYYVLSNRHVVDSIWSDVDYNEPKETREEKLKRAKTSTYNWPLKNGEELTNNLIYKVPLKQWSKRPLYGKTEFETKYNVSTSNFFDSFLKVVWVPNSIKTKPAQFKDNPEENNTNDTIDIAISTIDLKVVFKLLDRALFDQTSSLPYITDPAKKQEKQNIIDWLTGTKEDLEKWKNLKPLKFGNDFANLNNGDYLTNFYISAYPRQRTNVVYKINKINFLESRISYHNDYYLNILGPDGKPDLNQPGPARGNGLIGGASGSLIVDQKGYIQAIHSLALDTFGSSYEFNNATDVAYPFISHLRDVISYDKNNPNTFGSWLKQKAESDPEHFEKLDIYINPQKYWKN